MRTYVRLLAILSALPYDHVIRLRAEAVIFDAMREFHARVEKRYS